MKKVSTRELLLLILLLVVGLGYVLFTYVYSPMFDKISSAQEDFDAAQVRRDEYDNMANVLPSLKEQQAQLLADAEQKSASFLPDLTQSKIISFVNTAAGSQGMSVRSVYFFGELVQDTAFPSVMTETVEYPLGDMAAAIRSALPGAATPQAIEVVTSEGENGEASVMRSDIEIRFDSVSYSQILGFIKYVEQRNRTIYFDSISVNKNATTGELAVNLSYKFYAVDKVTDADAGIAQVSPSVDTGKTNPFSR